MSANRMPFEEAKKLLTVSSIPKPVKQQLAYFLDKYHGPNWECVADKLGIAPQEIEWVKNTVFGCPSGSMTFRLFEAFLCPREILLETFIEALESIKNLASVKVLTDEYANGAFDSTLKHLSPNGCKANTSFPNGQCLASVLKSCRSFNYSHHSPSPFHHSGNNCECPGHSLHGHKCENLHQVSSSPDGPFLSSSGSSTYGSMDGNIGDSISYTRLDSDLSLETSQHQVYERQVPFNEALFRAENQLPSINDAPIGAGGLLNLSRNGSAGSEGDVKVEPKGCCNGFRREKNGAGFGGRQAYGRCSCANCHYTDCRQIKQETECEQREPGTGQNHVRSAVQAERTSRPRPTFEVVKCEPQDGPNDKVPRPDKNSLMKENLVAKDSRSIRVFVTYSDDSKKHMRHVMQLCECLKKNNFSVSLDVRESALLSRDRIGWYDKRFKVADCVLVLISPKYFQDVMEPERSKTGPDDDLALNTLYIHRCMQAEYMDNKCINKRFIPVVMPGASKSHIPVWLQNTTKYVWPEQYKNLFFYMMYPEHAVAQFVLRERSAKMPTVQQTNN